MSQAIVDEFKAERDAAKLKMDEAAANLVDATKDLKKATVVFWDRHYRWESASDSHEWFENVSGPHLVGSHQRETAA